MSTPGALDTAFSNAVDTERGVAHRQMVLADAINSKRASVGRLYREAEDVRVCLGPPAQ
jgi:hypothetical protein